MTNKPIFKAGVLAGSLLAACSGDQVTQVKQIAEATPLYVVDGQLDDYPSKLDTGQACLPYHGRSISGTFTTFQKIKNTGLCKDDKGRSLTYIRFDFERGSSQLSPESQASVLQLKAMMDESGATGITLTGNADPSGTEKGNLLLSWERASNVANALKKVAPDLDVHTEARGSDFCEVTDDPDCRRVTISVNNMVFSNG